MGTPVAVCYANLVLFSIEEELLRNSDIVYYRRYVDDLFIIAERPAIENFFTTFSNKLSTIKLESITIGEQGVFLDLNIQLIKDTNYKITYSIYQKEFNRYQYITTHSDHSTSAFQNIITNEIKRYCLLTKNRDDFVTQTNLFYSRLLAR